MSDESRFKVMLPGVLYIVGDAEMVRIWQSTAIDPNHPALALADWYVKGRKLVAAVIEEPRDDDRFHEGCVVSVFVTPAGRLALLESSA